MKFLTTLSITLLFLYSCQKKDTPSVLPSEMKIISIQATKWLGDSICGTRSKHYGD